MDEDRISAIEAKLELICNAITQADCESRRCDFHDKWSPAIEAILPDVQAINGDSWNEEDGLWTYHESHRTDDGYDEDAVIGGYLTGLKEKFDKLKGVVEEVKEALPEGSTESNIAENHIEMAESAIEQAEEAMETAQGEITDNNVEDLLFAHPMLSAI